MMCLDFSIKMGGEKVLRRNGIADLQVNCWLCAQIKPAGVVSPKLSRILLEKGAVSPPRAWIKKFEPIVTQDPMTIRKYLVFLMKITVVGTVYHYLFKDLLIISGFSTNGQIIHNSYVSRLQAYLDRGTYYRFLGRWFLWKLQRIAARGMEAVDVVLLVIVTALTVLVLDMCLNYIIY
ncbi:hypothetical protein AVEN_61115-1 [Araneus ventricosus]|uniref:Uncharacterized protein n=1 Tax=Araneus ventricosus TaxID=182803 RepID=A0A4Y2PXP0_ARAVE|nr:hypothetical protein AVEN_61115-1 [Araneus ventricosus]